MQGSLLGSRYRIIEYIAKGGFGKTYLAEDTQLPNKGRCVVKQLYPSVEDPNFVRVARRLFKTEAYTLNTLGTHNQIPQLLAYFEEAEKFYLVQQYIEGHTLTQELIAGKSWSEAKVIELLQDCLNILNFIHSQGVIHRDVKPDNLIRRQSDNKLVLVDFGTVKEIIVEQTQLVPGTVAVGTRGYMPSEQARGKPRITSDIYALGVIAIQALTGVHPVELEENDEGEIIWQEQANCSPGLKAVIAKMTQYHFKERQQNATEVITEIASLSDLPMSETVKLGDKNTSNMPPNARESANLDRTIQPNLSVVADSKVVPAANGTNSDSEYAPASPGKLNVAPSHQNKSNVPKTRKSSKILAIFGTALVGAIAIAGVYFLNRQSNRVVQKNTTEQVAELAGMLENQDYQGCYDRAVALKTASDRDESAIPLDRQQELEANCGLELAKQSAENLQYREALKIATTLPKSTSLGTDIQQEIDNWSVQLLEQATRLYEQEGKLEEAIALVEQIPQDSAIATQVIDAKTSWKTETQKNEDLIKIAEKALSEEKWRYAKQQASKINSYASAYWQEQAQTIISQADDALKETEEAIPAIETPAIVIPSEEKSVEPEPETVEPVIPEEEEETAPEEKTPEATTPTEVEPEPEIEKPEATELETTPEETELETTPEETLPGIETPEATTPTEVEPEPETEETELKTTPEETPPGVETPEATTPTEVEPEPENEETELKTTPEETPPGVETPEANTPTEVKPVEPKRETAKPDIQKKVVPEKIEANPALETERDIQDRETIQDSENNNNSTPNPSVAPTDSSDMPLRDL